MGVGEIGLIILAALAAALIFTVFAVWIHWVFQMRALRQTVKILVEWAEVNPLEVPRFREMLVQYFGGYTGIAELEKRIRKRLGTETKADKESQ